MKRKPKTKPVKATKKRLSTALRKNATPNNPSNTQAIPKRAPKKHNLKNQARKQQATPKPAPPAAPVVHLLLRVRTENGRTINAHQALISSKGTAMLGKMGKPVGRPFRDALNRQIQEGIRTYLFLTTREGWNGPYVTYQCLLRGAHETLDDAQKSRIPGYYASSYPVIGCWFEISSIDRLSRDEMNRIFVLSSGRTIMSVIKSTGAYFFVGKAPRPAVIATAQPRSTVHQ